MLWEALLLGIVQGLTEFLPISSSAHLTLLPWLLGWHAPLLNSLAFDVALHLGTLLALLAYFWRDLLRLLAAGWGALGRGRPFGSADARLAWYLVLGTLPVVLVALLFGHRIETVFRAPQLIAACLIGMGLLMGVAERFSTRTKAIGEMTLLRALGIGAAQALALVPGVSRSGATLAAGMALGFRREDAARFSFLLAVPAVAGAFVLQVKALAAVGAEGGWVAMAVGVAASAGVGALAIHGLLGFLRRYPVYVFIAYRCALAAWVLWVVFGA
jgi:undecaprenyl-diphosphatase